MDVSNRVTQLEDEIKVLKNELLAVLLDVKENLLTRENPFGHQQAHSAPQLIAFSQQASAPPEPTSPQPVSRREPEPEPEAESLPTAEEEVDCEPAYGLDDGRASATRYEPQQEMPLPKKQSMVPDDGDDSVWVDELVKSWRPLDTSYSRERIQSAPAEKVSGFGGSLDGNISLATLSGLAGWVTENSRILGAERVQTIFDISEMMGDIPSELKITLEKLIPHSSPEAQVDSQQIAAQSYLSALKQLATLLRKENVNDFVVMHMVSHGLNSRRRGVQ